MICSVICESETLWRRCPQDIHAVNDHLLSRCALGNGGGFDALQELQRSALSSEFLPTERFYLDHPRAPAKLWGLCRGESRGSYACSPDPLSQPHTGSDVGGFRAHGSLAPITGISRPEPLMYRCPGQESRAGIQKAPDRASAPPVGFPSLSQSLGCSSAVAAEPWRQEAACPLCSPGKQHHPGLSHWTGVKRWRPFLSPSRSQSQSTCSPQAPVGLDGQEKQRDSSATAGPGSGACPCPPKSCLSSVGSFGAPGPRPLTDPRTTGTFGPLRRESAAVCWTGSGDSHLRREMASRPRG